MKDVQITTIPLIVKKQVRFFLSTISPYQNMDIRTMDGTEFAGLILGTALYGTYLILIRLTPELTSFT